MHRSQCPHCESFCTDLIEELAFPSYDDERPSELYRCQDCYHAFRNFYALDDQETRQQVRL